MGKLINAGTIGLPVEKEADVAERMRRYMQNLRRLPNFCSGAYLDKFFFGLNESNRDHRYANDEFLSIAVYLDLKDPSWSRIVQAHFRWDDTAEIDPVPEHCHECLKYYGGNIFGFTGTWHQTFIRLTLLSDLII